MTENNDNNKVIEEINDLKHEIDSMKQTTDQQLEQIDKKINHLNHKRKKSKSKLDELEQKVDENEESKSSDQEESAAEPPKKIEEKKPEQTGDKDKAKKKKEEVKKVSYRKLYMFADRYDALLIIFGALGALVHGAVLPAFSFLFGKLIDTLASIDTLSLISGLTPYFILAGAVSFISTYMQSAFFQISAQRQITKIRDAYLQAMMRQEVGWFDQNGTGALISRIAGDTTIIKEGFGEKIGSLIQFYAMFIAGFALGFWQGWKLTLVLLAVTPLLAFAGALMMRLLAALSTRGQAAYAQAGSVANETLISIRTVSAFNIQNSLMDKYNNFLHDARITGMKKGFVTGISIGFVMMLMFLTWALGLWYGSTLVVAGEYTTGTVFTVFFSVIIGAFALGQATPSLEAIGNAQGAGYKLFETLERKSKIDPTSDIGFKPSEKLKGQIEFSNVQFRYPTRPDVLVAKGISFKVNPGETVALVGESGSGKSSIIALLQRFYDPESGDVLVDGKKVSDYNLKWYRQNCGYVGQEPVLFSGTIAENIAFGKGKVDMKEIEHAAKLANAHKFIQSFPDGYDTQVGERGTKLSGGQKQRIAIARALLSSPSIMLLDEATSALDSKSERVVQKALDSIMKNHTTIVVAHRLSTIRDADRIYVLSQGQVVESGRHEDLMQLGGRYAGLVRLQGGDVSSKKDESSNNKEEIENKDDDDEEPKHHHAEPDVVVKTGCCGRKVEEKKKEDLYKVPLSRIFKMNTPELPYLAIGLFGALITGSIQPSFSLIFSKLTAALLKAQYALAYDPSGVSADDVVQNNIVPYVYGFIGIACAAFIANLLQAGFFGIAAEYLTERFRKLSFSAMLRQEIGWFDEEKHSSGALTSRLATEAPLINGLLGTRLGLTVQNFITIAACLGIAFYYSWALTLVILATFPLMAIGSMIELQSRKGFTGQLEKANQEANQVASEAVSNIRTVAAFVAEEKILNRYHETLKGPHKVAIKTAHLVGAVSGFGQLLMFCCYALDFYVGGKFIDEGIISDPTDFMYVLMSILMAAQSVGQASALAPNMGEAQIAASHIFETLDSKPTIDVFSEKGEQPKQVVGDIEFQNVKFRYPTRQNQTIFNDLSLKIPKGSKLALVGASGSGKSTIVQLLERFYDTENGNILLDGKNIKDFNVKWLRQQYGLVSQEPILFTGTISDNIRLGKPDATQEEIENAAKSANAHKFISTFPDGYNTQVGEKGSQLSGGQKQRIAIARAIIKDPRILLLDEATSALDTESEKVVQKALDSVMQGRTTIIVAHRLSTIRDADQIYVLDAGSIVEHGTHDELMQKQGVYWALQATAKTHNH